MLNKPIRFIVMITVCIVLAAVPGVYAQKQSFSEYTVKAAFLYNFARFVDWPAGAFTRKGAPFTVCIYGTDPFGRTLDAYKAKSIKGRKLVFKRNTTINEIQACHVLFISASEEGNVSAILQRIRGKQVLSVADMEAFARRGGMINLIKEKNKIRFEINLSAAERAGLTIGPKLRSLAKIVK